MNSTIRREKLVLRIVIGAFASAVVYAIQISGFNFIPDDDDKGRYCMMGQYLSDIKYVFYTGVFVQCILVWIAVIMRYRLISVLLFLLPMLWGYFTVAC